MEFISCPDCGETVLKRMELDPDRQILYWMCPECGTVHFENGWVSSVPSKDAFDAIVADTGKTGRFLFDSGIEVIGFERSSEETRCEEFISITECLQWFIDNQPANVQKESLQLMQTTQKYDYVKDLYPAFSNGLGCAHCGRSIRQGDLHLDCPDCAAIFCESCVRNGTFENHSCEEYDWDDD